MEIIDENMNGDENSCQMFCNELKLSDSPLMENSQQLSQLNITKYIHNNFKDFKKFDLLNFSRKRNFEDLLQTVEGSFILEEEEKNCKSLGMKLGNMKYGNSPSSID